MTTNPIRSNRRRSAAIRDLVVLASICLAVYLILMATNFDLFERVVSFVEQHESWEFDEVLGVSVTLLLGLGIFGLRRYREAQRDRTRRRQTEQTLAREHALLHTVIDALPDYIFAKDAEGRFILSNQAHAQAVNAPTADALVGRTALDFFPPELAAQFDADDRAIMESGQPLISQERQTVNADGSRIWVSTTKMPLRDAQGNVNGLVGISRDISDQKQAEDALAAERNLLRTVTDNLPDNVVVKDTSGRIVLVNQSQVRFLDANSAEDLIGKTAFDLLPHDLAARIQADDETVLRTGQAILNHEQEFKIPAREPRWILESRVPLRDSPGDITGFVIISRDITERNRDEQALRESEERFRRVARATNDAIWDWDLLTNQVQWSEAFQTLFGYHEDVNQHQADWWLDRIHPEDRERIDTSIQAVLKFGGNYWSGEYRFQRADGGYAAIVDRGFVERDERNKPLRMTGSMMDVTERKQAEERLRESEERFRAMFEQAVVGIAHSASDGRWILANQKFCDILGYTREEMLARTWMEMTHPDDVNADYSQALRLLAGEINSYSIEKRFIRKDSSHVWVNLTTSLVREPSGKLKYGTVLIEDITERKRIEEALKESETRFRRIVEAASEGICMTGPEVRITFANRRLAEMLGYGEEELIGKSLEELMHQEADASGERWDYRLNRKDGSKIWAIMSAAPFLNDEGLASDVLIMLTDITERKNMETMLRESEANLRNLIASTPAPMLIFQDTMMRFVNPAAEELIGYSQEELSRFTFWDMIHPDMRDMVRQRGMQRQQGASVPQRYEVKVLTKSGEERWVDYMGTSIQYEGKQAVLGIVVDITERKAAAERLRESEERFRILFEHSPDAILLIDPHDSTVDWPIVDCNEAACTMNGYAREELIGQTIDILNATRAVPGERGGYLRRIREAGILQLEAVHRRKDGALINIQIHTSVVNLNGRELVLGIDRDITAHKQAEEALRESEERFRATFEQAAVGVGQTDMQGHFIRINRKLCDITGYAREELMALTWLELTYPDDLNLSKDYVRQLLDGDRETYSQEKRYIRKNGTLVWVNVTVSLVRTPEGKPGYFVAVVEDITERKQAAEERRESEERFRQLAENMHQAIWLRDVETNATLYMNPSYLQVFGDTRDNLFAGSDRFRAVVHPDDLAAIEADRAAHHFGGSDHENRIIRDDGSVRWLRVQTFPVHDAQGNPYRVVGMAEDITERKQAEAQKAELAAERARMKVVEQFVQSASHDLRTPLTIMQTSAFLLAKTDEPEKKQRHLQNLEDQIAHITRVLQDFLDLSRLDQLTLELQVESCDVGALVQAVREEQQPLVERKQHHVQLNLAPDLPPVPGDGTALQHAFRHLLVNALHYTPDGGQITLAAFRQDDYNVIEVQDNGIGISDSELPFIFERFYRADKARSTDTGASGLGLTISKKIIEAHHGTIEVESVPGQGSTFRVLLPIQSD